MQIGVWLILEDEMISVIIEWKGNARKYLTRPEVSCKS